MARINFCQAFSCNPRTGCPGTAGYCHSFESMDRGVWKGDNGSLILAAATGRHMWKVYFFVRSSLCFIQSFPKAASLKRDSRLYQARQVLRHFCLASSTSLRNTSISAISSLEMQKAAPLSNDLRTSVGVTA